MGLKFYKPTQKNTGAACEFSFNSKESCLFIGLVKQIGYDQSKRLGSFKGGEQARFKFSLTEIAGMIDALNRNAEYPMFHSSEAAKSVITFKPYLDMNTNQQKGFSLSISKTSGEEKLSYRIGFTFQEMELIKRYLIFSLEHCFSAIYSADKKKAEQYKKTKEKEPTEPTDSKDPWGGEENPDDDF